MHSSNSTSRLLRPAIALVLALGLLTATVSETFAGGKNTLSCDNINWDCFASKQPKHQR